MPENQYFRQPDTQNIMVDILFVWSKLNSDVGYRQGMHELLALVLWVVERDAVQPGQTRKETKSTKILKVCFDSNYVTHDTFTLFSLIMHNAKYSYEVSNQGIHNPSRKPNVNLPSEPPMVVRSKRIMSEYLGEADPRLAMHLHELDIVPQVFIM
jgi:TBC1 domain family protein 5